MSKLESALDYINRGWAILPLHSVNDTGGCSCGEAKCRHWGKHPIYELVPHGFKNASKDPMIVSQWWTEYPEANIGVATGEISQIIVIDIDCKKEVNGFDYIKKYEKQYGSLDCNLRVQTPSGGEHLYFFYSKPVPSSANTTMGIDIRGDGGYIVVPPSNHLKGVYQWKN